MLGGVLGALQNNNNSASSNAQANEALEVPSVDSVSFEEEEKLSVHDKYDNWSMEYMKSDEFEPDTLNKFEVFLMNAEDKRKRMWLHKFEVMLKAKMDMSKMVEVMKALSR